MSIITISCLEEIFIPFLKLYADWKGDKQYPEQSIQRFISLNRESLSFLGISASFAEVNNIKGLRLITSRFVGAAPLRKPSTGKYYTDIQVVSRFGENLSDWASLLQDTLEPIYLDKPLMCPDHMRAPFYFDCINYFHSFLKAIPEAWNKFDTITKVENHPSSSTNWSKYIQTSINPLNALRFENRKNILSRNHIEWQELTYVLFIALTEFSSTKTPLSIKQRFFSVVSQLKRYLNEHERIKPIGLFQNHSSEPVNIKELKENANKILEHHLENYKAWRLDSAELFERCVQYVMGRVGKIIGAHVLNNSKFAIRGDHRPSWVLRYLEPDIIINKENAFYFVDAKYKAHMLNVQTSSDTLKETFRADFHQVLAYSSFDSSKDKTAMLVYPCNKFKSIRIEAVNRIGNVRNQVFLIGLPFTTVGLDDAVEQLSEVLRS